MKNEIKKEYVVAGAGIGLVSLGIGVLCSVGKGKNILKIASVILQLI